MYECMKHICMYALWYNSFCVHSHSDFSLILPILLMFVHLVVSVHEGRENKEKAMYASEIFKCQSQRKENIRSVNQFEKTRDMHRADDHNQGKVRQNQKQGTSPADAFEYAMGDPATKVKKATQGISQKVMRSSSKKENPQTQERQILQ